MLVEWERYLNPGVRVEAKRNLCPESPDSNQCVRFVAPRPIARKIEVGQGPLPFLAKTTRLGRRHSSEILPFDLKNSCSVVGEGLYPWHGSHGESCAGNNREDAEEMRSEDSNTSERSADHE